jgi:hypothetical protein
MVSPIKRVAMLWKMGFGLTDARDCIRENLTLEEQADREATHKMGLAAVNFAMAIEKRKSRGSLMGEGDDVLIHFGGTLTDHARISAVDEKDGYYVSNVFDDIPSPTGCFGVWVGFDQVDDPEQAVWIERKPHE